MFKLLTDEKECAKVYLPRLTAEKSVWINLQTLLKYTNKEENIGE